MTRRFGRFPIDLRIFQPVVYSKIDPNRCKSMQIHRNVSYDTPLDAASATMLIVSSENYKNRPKIEYLDVSSLEIHENIRKFIKNQILQPQSGFFEVEKADVDVESNRNIA